MTERVNKSKHYFVLILLTVLNLNCQLFSGAVHMIANALLLFKTYYFSKFLYFNYSVNASF